MEQEPVYVISEKLSRVCEQALGKIYDHRKAQSQDYVQQRTYAYNAKIAKANKIRSKLSWLGVKPKDYLTPFGMEQAARKTFPSIPCVRSMPHMVIWNTWPRTP